MKTQEFSLSHTTPFTGQEGNVQPKKPYVKPAISHELALETRAGSAFGPDPVLLDPMNPLNSLFQGEK